MSVWYCTLWEGVLGTRVTDGSDSDVVVVVAGANGSGKTITDSRGSRVDSVLSDTESGTSTGELGIKGSLLSLSGTSSNYMCFTWDSDTSFNWSRCCFQSW